MVAGAGTALSPCALPVLPALLSAAATGGRRRPLGIVLGLAATFTITIVGIAELADGVGAGTGALRYAAIAFLLVFGLTVAIPPLAQRMEAPLARLSRLGPRTKGDGFVSGLGVGAALGFVYAPCAGPILAAVIAVSAASGRTVAVAVGYATGAAAVLLVLALGGRRLTDRVRSAGRGPALQVATGLVMVATALVMFAKLDIRFQTALAQRLGDGGLTGFLANPTGGLEKSHAVKTRLADLRGKAKFDSEARAATSALPDLGTAPDFTDTQRWFNTAGGAPLTMAQLRGRVVLIDFWTYTCINCIRTQPYLKAWDAKYRDKGLEIVGVHAPEFAFEKDAGNVAKAIDAAGLRYPVVQDNDYGTWSAYGNQYWPAEYLVDAKGEVRHTHFGEGEYAQTEAAIRSLLAERGTHALGGRAHASGAVNPSPETTPETYLGSSRAERWLPAAPKDGLRRFSGTADALPLSHFAYSGTWRITRESATAVLDASIQAHVQAKDVYLVLGSAGAKPRRVRVLIDSKPYRTVTVRGQRLYTLVSLARPEEHRLTVRLAPGVSGFAFTFG